MNGMVPIYGEDGTLYYVTPEAALRSIQEGSGYATDPTAIYSPEAAQQLAEFTAALQGEDVYTRRLQAMAQQYGAQTQQYSAVAQNAYNMGQLLMNASINNPYQYAQQAFQTDGSAPGFARALAQGFSYGEPTADPFDSDRLKGWDMGKTSAEQGPPQKSQGAPDYGGPPPAQSSTPPAAPAVSPAPTAGGAPLPPNYAMVNGLPVGGRVTGGVATPGMDTTSQVAFGGMPGAQPGQVYSPQMGRWVDSWSAPMAGNQVAYGNAAGSGIGPAPGYQQGKTWSPEMGRWVDGPAVTSGAYSNTAPAAPAMASYGALSGVSGHGSSDIAHVNKEHDLIRQHGYGTGSDARSAAYAAAGMRQAEFNRLVKHGQDPFQRQMATGGIQVATHPQTVHVGEGGRDELLIALPLQRPGTAVPGFAAQIANDLHPQGNYAPHGGASPPGLDYRRGPFDPNDPGWITVEGPSELGLPRPGGTSSGGRPSAIMPPHQPGLYAPDQPYPPITLNRGRPGAGPPGLHMAQGGAVYGSGVNTLGVGNYRMSGSTPTPQGSVRVYGNRGGMKTAPVTEGIMPAGMGDPVTLDKIAANKFLAQQYDSLLRQQGYAPLDDYLARNQAARPQQRVQAGIGYRGY